MPERHHAGPELEVRRVVAADERAADAGSRGSSRRRNGGPSSPHAASGSNGSRIEIPPFDRGSRPTPRTAARVMACRQRPVAVGRDVDDGVERPVRSRRRGPRASAASMPGQQRRARPARDEHAVPEPEARLVGVVEAVELRGDARPLGLRGGIGGLGRRSPARGTRAPTRSPAARRAADGRRSAPPARPRASRGRSPGPARTASSASPNGRAAASRARNRGAPSNSGASAAAKAVRVELVEVRAAGRTTGARHDPR